MLTEEMREYGALPQDEVIMISVYEAECERVDE